MYSECRKRFKLNLPQRQLFKLIENSGNLVFACGPNGISANLVGHFKVQKNSKGEDQLNVGDGTHHVHVDWSLVNKVTLGDFYGQGLLTFFHNNEVLFKIYRIDELFNEEIDSLCGELI